MTTRGDDVSENASLLPTANGPEESFPSQARSMAQHTANRALEASIQDLEAAIAAIEVYRDDLSRIIGKADDERTNPNIAPFRTNNKREIQTCFGCLFLIAAPNSLFLMSSTAFREGEPKAVCGFVMFNVMLFLYLGWLWRLYLQKQLILTTRHLQNTQL